MAVERFMMPCINIGFGLKLKLKEETQTRNFSQRKSNNKLMEKVRKENKTEEGEMRREETEKRRK